MKPALVAVPRTVWVLGLVSLFMDLSSEIVHALLPLFLTTTLGVSVAVVGTIDVRQIQRFARPSARAISNACRVHSGKRRASRRSSHWPGSARRS